MKILYLADSDLDKPSGVAQKILMQSNQWVEEGHEVTLLSLDSLSFFSLKGARLTAPRIIIKRRGWKVFIHLHLSSWRLKKILRDIDYDMVYMRYRYYSPFLKRALGHSPQVVEVNTDDINETKLSSKLLYQYNKCFRNYFLRSVNGFVCVSRELQKKFYYLDKPTTVIANGISIDKYSFESAPNNIRPTLVFIGSPNQKWHGVDKIIYLAKKLVEFDFHILGMDGMNSENLFFHGYLPADKAKSFVKKQNIGIGTLSLYKNKMTEASPLKTRQYFAHGLPVIYAYEDTDINEEVPFALKLPNEENNIVENIKLIRDFVWLAYNDNAYRQMARSFAENKLDVTIKEEQRLKFFDMILQSKLG